MSHEGLLQACWGTGLAALQLAGIFYAVQAVMMARTPQSAIGWGLALVLLPALAIPLFWIFGESRFQGYALARQGTCERLDAAARAVFEAVAPHASHFGEKFADAGRIALALGCPPAMGGNSLRLLVDGEETFAAIFEAIDRAEDFLVVQFYIIHDDGLGGKLREAILRAADRGVRCFVLYDAVGSKGLDENWCGPLRRAGVAVHPFVTNRQRGRRFQINFRNHRKLVVADGRVAFLGGLNAGDEYLGLGPLGPWRDTHLRVEGPAATAMLVPFLEDWNYATHDVPDLPFTVAAAGDQRALPFASGPAQPWQTAPAVYHEILHDARERLWIASPYFVPDPATRTALAHAALRGLDVRILLPGKPDHILPWLTSFTFYPQMLEAGVRIWRLPGGFLHQKVLLADSDLAIVGSVNLDYRSFAINFEAAVASDDRRFAADVERMLAADFARAKEEDLTSFSRAPFLFRLRCRLASLMSPEQ